MSIEDFIGDNRAKVQDRLTDFLSIPSISTSPEHNDDCVSAARWTADCLQRLGCDSALLASQTHPVVWAQSPYLSRHSVQFLT